MKNILKIAFLAVALSAFASCNEKVEDVVEYLDVTANNLAGDWKLETWNDGIAPEGDVAVYLRFVRKKSRYEMYSNVGSMDFVRQTGDFVILTDELAGCIIRGSYDNTLDEEWNHRYVVRLTADKMEWTAYDNPADVCVYVRCTIPDEIVSAFTPVEE